MKERCYSKNSSFYKNYGARGIVICDEWLNNFDSLYEWSIKNGYEKGLQIDRINNNGIYEPDNCRYVKAIINANNKRNNIIIVHDNITDTLSNTLRRLGLFSHYNKIYNRIINLKWSFEDAIINL